MKCQEQSKDSEACGYVPKEGEVAEPEFMQPRGNAEAQERMRGEPVDIDVVDKSGGPAAWASGVAAADETQVDVAGGISAMVDAVKQRAGDRPIRRLSIYAHASPGSMKMGPDRINVQLSPEAQAKLAELAPLFAEDGFVELHACEFGAGESGEQMLWVLHETWGVPVIASLSPQNPAFDGLEGSTVTGLSDEEGYFKLEREDHPVADLMHKGLASWGAFLGWAYESGADVLEVMESEGEDMLSTLPTIPTPEVGDLSTWIFGP